MKKILSLIVVLMLAFGVKAQTTAPDFDCYDEFGRNIHLYDVLDNGQYAFLYFFFTEAEDPESQFSQIVAETYYNYGANQDDVYFIGVDPVGDTLTAKRWSLDYQTDFPIIHKFTEGSDVHDICESYGVRLIPTLKLVAPDHSIIIDDLWPVESTQHLISEIDAAIAKHKGNNGEEGEAPENPGDKEPQFVSKEQQNRNVLIEELTGRLCGYCPGCQATVNQLVAKNPERIFSVNIHAQSSLSPTNYPNLNTTKGATLFNAFIADGIPAVVINRMEDEQGTLIKTYPSYCSSYVDAQMKEVAEVNMGGRVVVNPVTRIATITVEAYYTGNSEETTNYLTIMMLQDSIFGSQSGATSNPAQIVNGEYCHMHTLRDIVTETWGDAIAPTTVGSLITKTYTYEIPEVIGDPNGVEVDLDNIQFLAFITEKENGAATEPILNVCELDKIEETDEPIYPFIKTFVQEDLITCDKTKKFTVNVVNGGTEVLTSIKFEVSVNNGETTTQEWTGSIPVYENVNIDMFAEVPFGGELVTVKIVEANGEEFSFEESVMAKSEEWIQVELGDTQATEQFKLELAQDRFGTQITWQVIGHNDDVIAKGGPYKMLPQSGTEVHEEYFTIPVGECVRFIIEDNVGNGINNNFGQGYYKIYDSKGNLLVESDGKFGFGEYHIIYVNGEGGEEVEIGDNTTIDYENYSLKFTVTSISPAECEVSGYSAEPVDVTIPSTVTISGKEFSVTGIGSYAFDNCTSLTNIEIPNSVTLIGYGAFQYCSNLTSIEIPNFVTSIGNYAFQGSGLISLTIPKNITYIGPVCFALTPNLETILVESDNAVYDSRSNCNAIIETATNKLITACKNTTIPHSITSIGVGAFAGTEFVNIEIPNSITVIEGLAFAACPNLENVTFEENSQLDSICPEINMDIFNGLFFQCEKIKSFEIPQNVKYIGRFAFSNCKSLTSLYCHAADIPETSEYAFNNCTSDMIIYVPANSVDAYKAAFPWNEYTILAMEEEPGDNPEQPGDDNDTLTAPYMRLANVYSEDGFESWDYIYSSPYDTDLVCINEIDFTTNNEIIDSIFYDERGNIIKIATWQKVDGEWMYACYLDYTYDENNLKISRKNYNNFGEGFELGGIYRYYYDEEGRMTYWALEFFGIEEYQKGIIEYNEDGLKVSEIQQQYSLESYYLENQLMTEYEYDENNNVERINEFVWEAGLWSVQAFKSYEYDEYGNCLVAEQTTASGTVQERKIYTYDTSVSAENVYYYPNPENDYPQLPESNSLLKSFEYWAQNDDMELVYETTYIVEYEMIEVVVEVNVNIENGTVTGAATYNYGEEVTLSATPNEGYKFVNWTENGEVVSTDQEFTFVVTSDRNLVANFELLTYEVAVTANPENAGTVTGTATYNHGEEVTLTAAPKEGYKFVNWTEDGEVVSTDQEFTFVATSDRNLVANFELLTYEVVLNLNPQDAGTVEGAGVYANNMNVTITATAKSGYKFVNWTENSVIVSTEAEYSFVITNNRNLVANFVSTNCKLTVVINPEEAGKVEGAGTYKKNAEVKLIATANPGYKFVNWTENDAIVSTNAEYSFVITDDTDLVANFVSTESISELTSSFNIYPNPANDKLYIETEVEIEEVVVYDAFGRLQTTVNGQQTVEVSNLNSGFYFVMIKTNEGVVTKRFVKQ